MGQKYFLDCEFTEYEGYLDLISIALVAEDGAAYYAVSTEFDKARVHEWLWENVMPFLADTTGKIPWKDREQIRQDIVAFAPPSSKPEFWAWFGSYDWVAFCWLFGAMVHLPRGYPFFVRDIRQYAESLGKTYIDVPKIGQEHNALVDALWNKDAYFWLAEREQRKHRTGGIDN